MMVKINGNGHLNESKEIPSNHVVITAIKMLLERAELGEIESLIYVTELNNKVYSRGLILKAGLIRDDMLEQLVLLCNDMDEKDKK